MPQGSGVVVAGVAAVLLLLRRKELPAASDSPPLASTSDPVCACYLLPGRDEPSSCGRKEERMKVSGDEEEEVKRDGEEEGSARQLASTGESRA